MWKYRCLEFRRTINMSKEILNQIEKLNLEILDKPENTDLLHTRAGLFTKIQNHSKAINDYITIIKINPSDNIAEVKLEMLQTIVRYSNIDIYANPNTNMDPWLE